MVAPATTPFSTSREFRAWLHANATSSTELWVLFYKLSTGIASMTWSESVDQALCYGWIDGQRKTLDSQSYAIRFTPRKKGSVWSNVNLAKIDALRAKGLMQPTGEAAFALRDTEKSGIYAHERATPAALTAGELTRFGRATKAWQFFQQTPPGYQRMMLHWIVTAKQDKTRASRLETLVEACKKRERLPGR